MEDAEETTEEALEALLDASTAMDDIAELKEEEELDAAFETSLDADDDLELRELDKLDALADATLLADDNDELAIDTTELMLLEPCSMMPGSLGATEDEILEAKLSALLLALEAILSMDPVEDPITDLDTWSAMLPTEA